MKIKFTIHGYTFSFSTGGKRLVFGFAVWKGETAEKTVREKAEAMVLEWLLSEKPTPEQVRAVIEKMEQEAGRQ